VWNFVCFSGFYLARSQKEARRRKVYAIIEI
jgi:hypothetical protein